MARARSAILLGTGTRCRPVRSRLSVGAATHRCQEAMDGVARTQMQAHVQATVGRRQKVAAEAQEFFDALPEEWGVTLDTVGPEHVLFFAQDEWLQRHPGTMLPDGQKVAAPSSLSGMLSHLSTTFELLGRNGSWDELSRTGNPILSKGVSTFKEGYRRMQLAAGYEVGSAVEWAWEEVQLVVAWLDTQAHELAKEALLLREQGRISSAVTAMVKALLMDRDAMAALYLWESMQRGKEVGELLLEDFCERDGSPVSLPLPFPLPVGFKVCVYSRLKQHTGERVEDPFLFEVEDCKPRWLQFLPRLAQHLGLRHEAQLCFPGYNLAVGRCLVTPCSKNKFEFEDRPLTSGAIYNRVVEVAGALGIYRGQSVHSFRRGSMQFQESQGVPREEVARRAKIKTPEVAARYFNKRRAFVKQAKQQRAKAAKL